MLVKHLDHLNLSVRSFAESAEWYGRVFGFEVVEQGTYRGAPWGVLRAGDALLCMYEDPGREQMGAERLRERRVHGVNHFALRIADWKEWEERVAREGIRLSYGDGAIEYPHSRSWYVTDPTGYEIEVVKWEGEEVRF